jgi:probable rRNA maturation factor
VEILIRDDRGICPDPERLRSLAEYVLTKEGAPRETELSIALVNGEEMAELNEKYLARKGPTDVLSFLMQEQEEEAYILGDVIVCPDEAVNRREEYGVEPGDEVPLVLTHGILHLMGYDDEEEEANLEMDTRQRTLLKGWGERQR